jgi:hypothetical protein
VKLSSVTLYKETLPDFPQVCAGKPRRFKWGKTVSDVTSRRDIPYSAKVLFDAFAQWGNGHEIVALSQVALADAIGGDRGTVQTALDALEGAGLIVKHEIAGSRSQVQAYRMLHPALVRRDKSLSAPEVPANKGLVKCAKVVCGKLTRPHKTGWCLKCRKDAELDGKVRRIAQQVVAHGVAERLAG